MKNLEQKYNDYLESKRTTLSSINAQFEHTLYLMEEILESQNKGEEQEWTGSKKLEISEYAIVKLAGEIGDTVKILINKR